MNRLSTSTVQEPDNISLSLPVILAELNLLPFRRMANYSPAAALTTLSFCGASKLAISTESSD